MPHKIFRILLLVLFFILPAKPSFAGADIAKIKDDLERALGKDLYILVVDRTNPDAYLHPMGYIVITKGMIEDLTDESELVFVIAHEVGHMEKRHYRGERGLLGLSQEAYNLAKEMEADNYGVHCLKALGYDPLASVHVLERLIKLGRGDALQLRERIRNLRATLPSEASALESSGNGC